MGGSVQEEQPRSATPEPGVTPIPFIWALVPVLALIGLLFVTIVVLDGSGHIPLILGACVAGLVAWAHGYEWEALQAGILKAIGLAMGAILILLIIGMLMGTWLAAGIVPALIAWGLELLSPQWFLPASCAVCSIVSLVSGSSWSTAGTVGLALIGVGEAMGIDPAMTAGAVISGAYFGDKLSPMSDTTNLAPAMAGTELFVHIRHMLWTTGPAWVIAMLAYTLIGLGLEGSASAESVAEITTLIDETFDPGLIHLAVPAVVALMVAYKFPALPTLLTGALLGGVMAWIMGASAADVLGAAMNGYQPDTGSAAVDELLARGGMNSMAGTVLLVLCAMSFGGIMEHTGQLRALASKTLAAAKSTGSLIAATILTAIGINVLAADQYLAVVVPGRMYAHEYAARGLHPKNLSRALEDGGTITSPLIPWNTCGAFMSSTLGVATLAYLPWCFLNLLNPIIGVLLGFTGWTIASTPISGQGAGEDEAKTPGAE
ncbi:Na+/H+ antiporter NhaC [Pseudenhygromyxa sp. WMMC2535]|uniref:Na+/H+ antiporter NhaC n=1 Tax=Pseudenhygromyxa sp. WMMC2535 TaxID=2712867 RepID=UPI0015542CB7|nr:Na+/H+ antiporter NhaC [Pseudenhygromyxa sp. WMMC2535]NVB37273.1 Na+/H+ antiporter NhaC [Pseudenhygromyxa sp. WMMC2535]NVB43613.1 Na+/H+ antiporter NhaC [Pseudenhygromyxa sp. WMMC2535]